MLSAPESPGSLQAGEPAQSGLFSGRRALLLAMIVLAGAVLRVIALGYKSFWIDEIASVAIARRASQTFWHFLWHDEGNMAAYYVVLRPWLQFGYREATVRLLSVIPGVASVPLIYVLARKLFGVRAAMVSALLLAFNACAIYVSQEARAYSFVVFAVLLSTCLFVLLIEQPTCRMALAYAVAAGLSCYFHYFCVLVPAAHFVAAIGVGEERRSWRLLLVAAGVIAIVSSPILWLMHAQDTGHISWVGPTTWLEAYHLGAYLSAASGKAVGGVLLALNLVLIGCFFKEFAQSWTNRQRRWRYLLVASSVITPIVLTVLVSIIRPAFYHRFLIVCLPGWIVMTAVGALALRTRAGRTAAIVGVCALSLTSTLILYHRVTEDWRSAVEYLIARAQPDDRILYYQPVGQFAGENYRDWLPGGGGVRPMSSAVNRDRLWTQQIDSAERIWLVLYRAKASGTEVEAIQRSLQQQKFQLATTQAYPGVTIMEFGKH